MGPIGGGGRGGGDGGGGRGAGGGAGFGGGSGGNFRAMPRPKNLRSIGDSAASVRSRHANGGGRSKPLSRFSGVGISQRERRSRPAPGPSSSGKPPSAAGRRGGSRLSGGSGLFNRARARHRSALPLNDYDIRPPSTAAGPSANAKSPAPGARAPSAVGRDVDARAARHLIRLTPSLRLLFRARKGRG